MGRDERHHSIPAALCPPTVSIGTCERAAGNCEPGQTWPTEIVSVAEMMGPRRWWREWLVLLTWTEPACIHRED